MKQKIKSREHTSIVYVATNVFPLPLQFGN